MPTQQQIADHLDMSQQSVAELMERLGLDWRLESIDVVRVAYIRHLRGQAAGHRSDDGMDLVRERVLTERVDRELKELAVAEKKGVLVNVAQLEPALMQMVGSFRADLLSRDDKLKTELDALYGIDLDVNLLNEHTIAALEQLGRYESSSAGADSTAGGDVVAAGTINDNGVGAAPSRDQPEGIGAAGAI
jgi:hypothetical protein